MAGFGQIEDGEPTMAQASTTFAPDAAIIRAASPEQRCCPFNFPGISLCRVEDDPGNATHLRATPGGRQWAYPPANDTVGAITHINLGKSALGEPTTHVS